MKIGDRVQVAYDEITPSHLGREGSIIGFNGRRFLVALEFGKLKMRLFYRPDELVEI